MSVRDELALQVLDALVSLYARPVEYWDHWLDCEICDPFGCGCCGDGCGKAPR